MPRYEDRFRTNTLNQLQESRIRNRQTLENIAGVDLSDTESSNNIEPRLRHLNMDVSEYYGTFSPSLNHESMWNEDSLRSFREHLSSVSIYGRSVQPITPTHIKPYNYKPDKFNFNSNIGEVETLFMGIELEIDSGGRNDDNAKFIQEYLGENNCYIMHDGSLNNGLEIVTHPCTLNYHKDIDYTGLFAELIKRGYKSHDTSTCGYHIHINRDFFGTDPTVQDLCITKTLYLLEKYWNDVKRIARRDSNRYSQRFNMKENENMFELLIKAKGGYSSKYNMVNLQHDKTIEFRMFRGTLKYETFIATMEFVYNLAYICKNTALEDIQNVQFKDILDINPTEYLIEYLNSRRS